MVHHVYMTRSLSKVTNPTDIAALIAAHAAPATEPPPLPSPAPFAELDAMRRSAQRRFDVAGLPRGLREVA